MGGSLGWVIDVGGSLGWVIDVRGERMAVKVASSEVNRRIVMMRTMTTHTISAFV